MAMQACFQNIVAKTVFREQAIAQDPLHSVTLETCCQLWYGSP